jgi:transposase
MGRSRGGLTTKIHALVDTNGLPVSLKRCEGQAHDGRSAVELLGRIGPGQILLADRAFDSDALRRDFRVRPAKEGRRGWQEVMTDAAWIEKVRLRSCERAGPSGDPEDHCQEKNHCRIFPSCTRSEVRVLGERANTLG